MNTQIIVDLPILFAALSFYFALKAIYKLICYWCCCSGTSSWDSGYTAGHNALADKIRPDIQNINKGYKKMQERLEKALYGEIKDITKTDDRKIPGQE
jgi:hypothetical protein